tara:strand:- start:644 stop:1345 length:702 start_codon:yes stop_codon:yes gene_type:complete
MPGPVPNVFRTGQLKSKILNLSQSSVYQVKIQPPPKVKDFIAESGRNFKYDKDGEDMELLCSETTLPGTSFSTHEVTNDFAGVTEKMAYRRMFDATIDMTFYVDKEYGVIEFFDGWMDWISGMNRNSPVAGDERELYRRNSANYRFNYPNTYKAPIYLTKFEKNLSDRQMSYEFVDAFPLNVISIPVSYAQSEILKLSVSFAYTRYIRYRSKSNVFTEYSDFFNDNDVLKIRL